MTLDPGPVRRDVAAEVRGAARRQAQRWTGAGPALVGVFLVMLFMGAFIILDYTFDQDPHRIIKVALGLGVLVGIVSQPRIGLLVLPVVSPFLAWIPPTPIPGLNTLNVLLFSVFGSFALSQVLARRPFLKIGRLGPVIIALLTLAGLSIIRGAAAPTGYGYNTYNAFLILVRSCTTFATYFIVLAMSNGEKDRRHITWAVLIGLLLESLVTIKFGRTGAGSRAVGSIGQSNELGAFLALLGVLAAALAVGARSWYAKLVAAGIFAASGFGIMLSLSRGSMLALVGGLALVTWRSSRWAFVLMVLLLVSSPLWVPDYVVDRINSSKVESDSDDGYGVDKASEARLMTWQAIGNVVEHHPFDGVGFTGLQFVLPDVGAAMGLTDIKDSAHNTYLRMLSEMGVFGLLLFLATLAKLFHLAHVAANKAKRRFDRAIAIGTCGSVVSMAISCAFGDRFWSPVVVSSLWVMAALVEDSLDHPAPEPVR